MKTDALDSIAQQALAEYQRHEHMQKKRAEEQQRQEEEQAEQKLRQALQALFAPEMWEQLDFRFTFTRGSYKQYSLFFTYQDYDWHITHANHDGMTRSWTIYRVSSGATALQGALAKGVEDRSLQAKLLLEMGKFREERRKVREQQAEYEAEQERRQLGI